MNFIDISSWQKGIDLAAVSAQNPLDGVIIKATEGTYYTCPEMKGWADYVLKIGKPLGLYHFMAGGDPHAEAAYFVSVARPYLGKAVLVADYEGNALKKGTKHLKEFLDTVLELTGVKPLVYCSLSVVQSQDFNAIAKTYKLWVAQYASMDVVKGFQENPWQKGSVSPFSSYVMHQYTGNGRLSGYSGALDLDKYLGSYSSWMEMAEGDEQPLKPADPEIIKRVLDGEFDVGAERIQRLLEAGYDPTSVQEMINSLYSIAFSCRKFMKGYEDYSESIAQIIRVL